MAQAPDHSRVGGKVAVLSRGLEGEKHRQIRREILAPDEQNNSVDFPALVEDQQVQGVVLIHGAMDQALLIRQLLEKGKHVLCTHPLAPTHQKARELVEQSGRSNAELSILSRGIHLDRAVAQALEGKSMGPLLFFNLEVLLNRPAPQEVGQGVVRRGMDCFDWLLRQGGVDTIAARTRNLASSGPAEDVALVQVRLRNGVEGGIQLNGLGQVSKVRLHLYGRDQDLELESDWEYGDELLRAQYQDFASLLEGARRPRPAETRVLESYLLVHWIQQAARLDRPVHRREVA